MTVDTQIKIETTECCACGIVFGVPSWFLKSRREDKKLFYCPNGHTLSYTESSSDILKREIEKLKSDKHEVEIARWRLHDELTVRQEEVKKLQASIKRRNKRIAAGVCPCCNRTFQDLANHMQSKHPEMASVKITSAIHKKINAK